MGACAREDMEPYSSWEFVSEEDMEVKYGKKNRKICRNLFCGFACSINTCCLRQCRQNECGIL